MTINGWHSYQAYWVKMLVSPIDQAVLVTYSRGGFFLAEFVAHAGPANSGQGNILWHLF